MAETSYIARTSGLKAKDYLGYAMIDAAGCLVFSLVTTLLQKFYTDIFHLSPLFIMLMFIGARIWDRTIAEEEFLRVTDEAARLGMDEGWTQPWGTAVGDDELMGENMKPGEGAVGPRPA